MAQAVATGRRALRHLVTPTAYSAIGPLRTSTRGADLGDVSPQRAMDDDRMSTTWVTTAQTARRMSHQARRETRPERLVRSALHAAGCRFRVSYSVPGLRRCSIDIAFPRQKLAVFIDGCFWHGCPAHSKPPKTNSEYWNPKIAGNQARDLDTDQRLRDAGWTVVRCWEHDDPVAVAIAVEQAVRGRR